MGCADAQAPHEHGSGNPAPFEQKMAEAMNRMDRDMSIRHSGDADRDFAAMMIPHHQGAIDMAKAELQFGRDPVLLRLAQGIIVEQQQEIEVMRRDLERSSPRHPPPFRSKTSP
ncbi:MAG TPA: DUF305 domain-containing protein [Usitatibacter sp.]|nr:DUF305 domain-containing protein [Usitatibacter sp.]